MFDDPEVYRNRDLLQDCEPPKVYVRRKLTRYRSYGLYRPIVSNISLQPIKVHTLPTAYVVFDFPQKHDQFF